MRFEYEREIKGVIETRMADAICSKIITKKVSVRNYTNTKRKQTCIV